MSRRTWINFDLRMLYRRHKVDKISVKDLAAEYQLAQISIRDRLWRARRLIKLGVISHEAQRI